MFVCVCVHAGTCVTMLNVCVCVCMHIEFYLEYSKPQTAFVILTRDQDIYNTLRKLNKIPQSQTQCRYTLCFLLDVYKTVYVCVYLHWSLLCRKELHWSGSLLSLAMVSRVASTCLNCGRSCRYMHAHGIKLPAVFNVFRSLQVRHKKHFTRSIIVSLVHLAYLWVCLPTFPHQLCKTCWTAGGDGQPLDTHKHMQTQAAEAFTFNGKVMSDHLNFKAN